MNTMNMEVRLGGLERPEVVELLGVHLRALASITPAGSMHALALDGLRDPSVTFWSVWASNTVLGCGALKELDAEHGEVKSMRTAGAHLRKGVAHLVLTRIIEEACARGYRRLSLETGSSEAFSPAHRLYERHGFRRCGPFGTYREDPNSVFMSKELLLKGAICIRPAASSDFDQLLILFRQLWPNKPIVPERLREVFGRILATPYKQYFCALEHSRIIGLGAVSFKDNLWQEGEIAYVEELVVHEERRGTGVGSLLLEHLIALAKARGSRRIELDTGFHREEAHRFYERHGMRKRAYLFSRVLNEL